MDIMNNNTNSFVSLEEFYDLLVEIDEKQNQKTS